MEGQSNLDPETAIVLNDSDDEEQPQAAGCASADPTSLTPEVVDLCVSPSTSSSVEVVDEHGVSQREKCSQNSKLNELKDVSNSSSSGAIECPICLQSCIHPARLPCGHIFCFLCVKGVAYKNRRCAMCRREIPPEFLDHPHLVNGIQDICKTKATEDGYQWFYEGRNGGWWAYDKRSSDEIEEAYTKQLEADIVDFDEHLLQILICGNIYTIDFVDMVQYPQNYENRRRKIRRSKQLLTKGVAGIAYQTEELSFFQMGWWQYDDRTSQDIDEAFKRGEKSCTILVAGYVYIVDFETMLQQRQNEPSRCRHVKRDLATIPKKGVAGLRIEGNIVATDSNFASQVQRSTMLGFDSIEEASRAVSSTMINNRQGLSLPLDYGLRHSTNASDFVSTIAATDAAIRIASDIIGSTLAHADELTRGIGGRITTTATSSPLVDSQHSIDSNGVGNGENVSNNLRNSNNSLPPWSTLEVTRGSRELLGAAEELLDATQSVISEADQQTIDLFEQTLNDFHSLTLRNIIDSSDDDDDHNNVNS